VLDGFGIFGRTKCWTDGVCWTGIISPNGISILGPPVDGMLIHRLYLFSHSLRIIYIDGLSPNPVAPFHYCVFRIRCIERMVRFGVKKGQAKSSVLDEFSSLLQRHLLVTDCALSHARSLLPLIYPIALSLTLNL
jgi:hypothetical protein